jgi:spore coat polysaccharide biosynthesis predicted glycosyltransferase SpsG
MNRSANLRVLFRAAAGPRRGFGHLVRCRSLARALGVRPMIAVRGGQRVIDTALALGCDVVKTSGPSVIAKLQPDVVVIDDPIAANAARWIAAARRAGCLVVSIHDLGLGALDADLVVDGSVTRTARAARGTTLAGTRYAVLDPGIADTATLNGRATTIAPLKGCATVLISLGGGPRAELASSIAQAIARVSPTADIRVVGGFMAHRDSKDSRVTWINTPRGLGEELARADVAVLGGGVSLYEACALGVPVVGVPVVRAQEPTVAAFAQKRASLGVPEVGTSPAVIAERAARLLRDAGLRRRISRKARHVVDGRGAARVAGVIAAMAATPRKESRCER